MTVKVLNDRTSAGRKHREWLWGIGNEAIEAEVFRFRGTYAAGKRAAIARAIEIGSDWDVRIVECYKDGPR